MLSIITSSYNPSYYVHFERNIERTCGVVYEIIKIENPGIMGLCEAYNLGGSKANYDKLLFIHEDVEFTTKNWGQILCDTLKNDNIGVVGVAGSNYVTHPPNPFWVLPNNIFLNLIQYDGENLIREYKIDKDEQVFSLDGVFLAVRKDVFEEFRFNPHLSGFHGYDLDFSVRVSSKYHNLVTSKIMLKHFSQGKADQNWMKALISGRKYYKISSAQKNIVKNEIVAYNDFINNLVRLRFSKMQILAYGIKYLNPFKLRYYGSVFGYKKLVQVLKFYDKDAKISKFKY